MPRRAFDGLDRWRKRRPCRIEKQMKDLKMTQIADARRSSTTPEWLESFRATSRATFTSLGLPTGKEESWRFTKLQPIVRENFADAEAADGAHLHSQYTF